ncbi:unnamed protein product [Hyaloperonospora brassicae]|uniref:UBA domain-containing protein n=1 Tax=Hyaloperonospora brassicae TaxID=162125 RepID=A0AAV0T3W7_HYABA|nr:unnamed protein product [Hyaloperonospora brassicae]
MADANVYFGDDFGQKIDLTVRIREILRNYPEGTSMFKEMVQNADDAGATEVNFCLDYRQHASTGLAYEKLGPFQGPALLVHNNATFTDADLQSIQRIGNSLKKDESMGWKTGRFGVGFNSVYHLTDLPSFVSGRQLVFFDPQACHLPNVNPSNPGKMIDYIAHPELVNNFPDQVSPFRCFGCNFAEPFVGTIFRLSLRTKEQAQRSRLSNRAQTPAQTAEMLEEFADTLPIVLLFLRNVCKISIWEWRLDEKSPVIVQEALINDMTSEVRLKRSLRYTSVAFSAQSSRNFSAEGTLHDYPLKIIARNGATHMSKEHDYFITNQLGGGECSKIACNPANVDQRLIPWGGVAVSSNADSTIRAASGLAFCFLPLPAHTHLPVHVNGYFELSSNRRDIWFGEGLSGEGLLRARWNIALLRDVIAPCYARAILHLASTQLMNPDQHVQLLPQTFPPAPWDTLASAFLSLIRDKPCLYSDVESGRWVSPAESMVFSSANSSSKQIEQSMVDDGFPVVRNLTEDQERVLIKTTTISSYAGPQTVREAYKAKHSCHAGNREAIKCLLGFMLSDLQPARLNALVGVNFLPVADGTLRKFESRPGFDPAGLAYLHSMGFSRQHAIHALVVAGEDGMKTALDWLLQNPNPSVVCREGAAVTYFIPSREELTLLEKARGYLVSVETLSQSGMNLLSSDTAGKTLNVQKLDYQGFEDMLAMVLPAAWFGKPSVPWTGGDEPNEEWFRRLWEYIGKSKHLSAFKEKWPIVPTSSDMLVQLSLSAGVLSVECIPDGCLRCLHKLQVRLLLPELFASFQPNPDVWQYIHQPTAVGVLSCIEKVIGEGGIPTRVSEMFGNTDSSDREHLLRFLISAVVEEIGPNLKHICCNLPILPGFRDATCADEPDVRLVDGYDNFESMDSGVSPAFVSVAGLKARRLEPMFCVGTALEFLHDNFVHVSEGDVLLASFLSHIGVRQISRVTFFAKHLIPRINYVKPKTRVKFVYELLVELPVLLGEDSDGDLLNVIETAAIFPTMTGGTKSINDLYDPEIDEFAELMDESFFPALELQDPRPLSALRSIGLQRALSRRSILSLAVSLEDKQTEISTASANVDQVAAFDEMCKKLRVRSANLFQYVNTHMDQLVTPSPLQMQVQTCTTKGKKVKGIRFLRNVLGHDRLRGHDAPRDIVVPTAEAVEKQAIEEAEIDDFKAKLGLIAWIPVEGGVEAFGQTEVLTKRIAHILEQYPDGPNIISELIQNADDAGATRVCVLYNSCSYGTSSLLSPAMAKWQGPSLFCYNDAEFSDGDFINLARIGQASKLQRAATTGRFGLGFNSVYHFTDLPSIVSAKSIVMFDPHATHLPGISAANPGIKIRFAQSSIVRQFPDQFAPYKDVFGCDLEQHYKGTLFRFPLRNNTLAESSEIKRRGYSHSEIVELFKSFQGSIIDSMLFLRNVRKVEIYLQSEIGQSPTLLYGAEVPEEDRGESWRGIDRFMQHDEVSGNAAGVPGLTAKREFYARLQSTPADKLPSVTQVLRIRRLHRKELAILFDRFSGEQRNLETQTVEAEEENQMDETVEKYLVCNQIGGGKAREMACAAENESLKLIPWVGIAGRVDGVAIEGRAFCFLPLPVRVGLPVHINGYFELSSNRRDIWTGDDMSGDGKLRSEWNLNLLVDAVAPAYLTFLLKAKAMCENRSQYFSFFPTNVPTIPWDAIALELFRIMKDQPMFFASATQLMDHAAVEVSERSVAPSACVLVDDTLDNWKVLEAALHAASLVTVHIPAALHSVLVQVHAVYGVMTPAFFRQLTGQGNFLPSLKPDILKQVVQFCLSDCKGSLSLCAEALDQQPILPLKDGNFEKIRFDDMKMESNELELQSKRLHVTYCFESALEERLLDAFPQYVVRGEFKDLFDQVPFVYEHTNLRVVNLEAIANLFLPDVLGNCWSKTEEGVFTFQPSSQVKVTQDKKDWIRLLWKYAEAQLQSIGHLPQAFTTWPLLPVTCDGENRWVCLGATVSLVLPHLEAPALPPQELHQLQHTLAKVGIYVIDTTYVSGKRSAQWLLAHKYAHRLTSTGLLAALSRYQNRHQQQSFGEIFAHATSADRQVLCNFFTQSAYNTVSKDFKPVLFELPIFPVHSKSMSVAASADQDNGVSFVSLRRGGYLPDTEADIRILSGSFFRADSEATRKFLRDCGIEELNYTAILLDHVFPHLSVFDRQGEDLVDSVIISALETLPFHQRNDTRFREIVSTRAIIPSRKRVFRAINQLHDPNVSELSELVGENSLPAHAFSTPPIVEILRSLGLRTGLSCHAVLESAHSIETMYREDDEDAVDRACLKAHSLLTIVNKHFDSMTGESSLRSDLTSDQDGHDGKEAILEVVAALKEIQWLPVLADPPNPAMPWRSSASSGGQRELLSSALNMRPLKDAWFCSSSLNVLDGELTSEQLMAAFGWKEKVAPFVVAKQLEAIGALWEEYCLRKDSEALLLSPPSPNWRFPLSEVHMMYEDLEDYRLADEEGWTVSPLYRKLANALWIWTGNSFAYPCQIAVTADASLEPLLYCCPSEHIIPRSLLASFGAKEAFVVVDYLEAIMRLPRHEVLRATQVAACLKIYEIVSKDTPSLVSALDSFASQEMVLLDQANQLVPAARLTFDDMEWDESREVRRGVTFVSKKVPETVARLLGATSLHSKLAQTSVSSVNVTCPSVVALQKMLPPQSKWHQRFLWETIRAAEQLGGTQVDFSMDFRRHASQRVIQPSLQPLQAEAICIHIHDVVLSEYDIENLSCKDSLHAGLLCGFFASDCMQILSGEGFYILDPTACYQASSVGPTSASVSASDRATSIGRRYEVLSHDFVRYPDQLLPFTSLPYCPGNVSRGTRSTLIRFPWRKTASALSSYIFDSGEAESLIAFVKSQLYQTLIFTETVHHLSLWSLGAVSEFASQCHGEVSLDVPERTLRKRNMTRKNEEWKKKFFLQSFFKSAVIPENQMEFVVNLEVENKRYRDTWIFADNNGSGRSRDLACTPTHEMLGSTPYVSVATHIFRDGSPAPHLHGHVYDIIDTGQQVGLPVHINGCFKRTMMNKNLALALSTRQGGRGDARGTSGSEQEVAAGWNCILLEDGVSDAYVKLLLIAKRRYAPNAPRALYNIWPAFQKGRGARELGTIVQTRTYHSIATRELFFCTDGVFRSLSSGYQLDSSGMNIQVASFAQLHFPAFDVPTRILQDCSHLFPSRMSLVTPKVMRRFLRSVSSSEVFSDVCLSLLEYCLSDLPFPLPCETDPIWTEFHGLSLLPLEDGSVGVLRVNHRRTSYVLASFNQIELLRPLGHRFVSLAASRRLHKFFSKSRFASVFGLASFSIKILSDYIERILPPFWKNQTVVDWDPRSPIEIDRLWLYRFWQEVHLERRSLGYFARWPLIPIKGSRLISCSKMDMVLCVWDDSADRDISAEAAKAFVDSALQQESKLADIDAEHRRFVELSAAKFDNEDEVADESTFDGQESVAYDGEHGNDEVADEMVSVSNESLSSGETNLSISHVQSASTAPLSPQNGELPSNLNDLPGYQDSDEVVPLSAESTSVVLENVRNDDEASVDDAEGAEVGEGFSISAYAMEDESHESCSRETLHNVLLDLNVAMMELAYFKGQEHDIVPRSADVGRVVLDGIFASIWSDLRWEGLSEARAVLIAEFFCHHGNAHGGYNRIQLERVKQLPIFVNICNELCALSGGLHYFLIPLELNLTDIPLPPDAQQCFLKSNPNLNAFYQELGVVEMSDSKLLIYVLPMYSELPIAQRNQVLQIILRKWQSLRSDADLTSLLSTSALFGDGESEDGDCYPASSFCDPRNSVLATIYHGVPGRFPAQRYQTLEWLDLMSEIGLQTEVTADIFVECAERIDRQCSGKQALSADDERLTTALHQFFVQNYDKFDRSRSFFERIAPLAFVPAILYEASGVPGLNQSSRNSSGSYTPCSVVRKYSDCAIPDDQALVYTTMPILANVALPPRVLFSRLCIKSPPPQDQVVSHLLSITQSNCATSSGSLNWQFFMPVEKVFQAIFGFLQENWDKLGSETQERLTAAVVIPVGSTLVKGSRLFFHLGENLAPLLYEVPRMFGAYDALFRRMGSKESPTVDDYIRLLSDLNVECCGLPLNLNELIAAARSVDLLVAAMNDSNRRLSIDEKKSIFLPSGNAVMRSMLAMAYNDSAALCSSIDLTQLPVVHPRISTRCCKILGVPGATTVVTEELAGGENMIEMLVSDDIAHFTSVLASQPFADGLRTIITTQQQKASLYDAFGFVPDFEDLNLRILSLATFEVKCVTKLRSRFIAKLDCPPRRIDVTKTTRMGSLSFLDQTSRRIYIAKRTLEGRRDMGLRASYLVARCVNQVLGGILQDCSVLESILTCDEVEIPEVLQRLDVYEDPVLIEEKLRGVLGQSLCEADRANVELAPLRSCLPGELVAIGGRGGTLYYGKILREGPSDIAGVSQYDVRVDSSATRRMLATEVYFFRSARVQTSSRFDAAVSEPSERQAEDVVAGQREPVVMPSSVVAIVPGADGSELMSDVVIPAPAVSSANVLSAVNDLLSRLNVTLDMSVEDLMAENLQTQRRLEVAEDGRRAAETQIDSIMREKKELLDALICAVCLENQVNRVLIPCGHVYCASCVEQLPRPSCPICRQNIASSSVFHVPS